MPKTLKDLKRNMIYDLTGKAPIGAIAHAMIMESQRQMHKYNTLRNLPNCNDDEVISLATAKLAHAEDLMTASELLSLHAGYLG